LWHKITERPPLGYVVQLWSSRHARGFDYRQYGESTHMLVDFDGLALAVIRRENRKSVLVNRRTKSRKQPNVSEKA
jgi:hypothetical protein